MSDAAAETSNNKNGFNRHFYVSMTTFNPYEWEKFFFGAMEREEAGRLLATAPVGAFLLRESRSRPGGYSLSVRECADGDHQVYNYFIERKEVEKDKLRFEICNNVFVDIPSLITYYSRYPLEKSCLRFPLPKQAICRVICRYKFDGERVTDLPFERGELLDVIGQPEEGWWMARNALDITGLIPVPYVKVYEDGDELSLFNPSTNSSSSGSAQRFSAASLASVDPLPLASSSFGATFRTASGEKRFSATSSATATAAAGHAPAWVRANADRHPSIYNVDALPLKATGSEYPLIAISKFQQGQLIYLIEVLPTGMCRGRAEAGGRIGIFPFTYVDWTNIALDAGPWTPQEAN